MGGPLGKEPMNLVGCMHVYASMCVYVRLCVSMVRDLKVTLFCLRSLASENGSKSWSQIRTRLELTNSKVD